MLQLSRVEKTIIISNVSIRYSPQMMDSDAVYFLLRVAEIFSSQASNYWFRNRCVDFITYIKFIGAIKALEK